MRIPDAKGDQDVIARGLILQLVIHKKLVRNVILPLQDHLSITKSAEDHVLIGTQSQRRLLKPLILKPV